METTHKGLNAENAQTTIASTTAETPADTQPEPMPAPYPPFTAERPLARKPGRPRKSRSNPDLTADPTWVIYRSSGQHAEGHIVREVREDGRSDGVVIVENGMGQVPLLQSEEWRCWYRPALVSAASGTRPRDPLQDATVRIVRIATEGSAAAAAAAREPSWVSADGATSENPTPRRRKRRQGMDANEREIARRLEAGEVDNVAAPKLSPLDWLNLRYAAQNFRAACEGENEPEARRLLTLLRGVANHVWPAV
jgi:hypothetical protein